MDASLPKIEIQSEWFVLERKQKRGGILEGKEWKRRKREARIDGEEDGEEDGFSKM